MKQCMEIYNEQKFNNQETNCSGAVRYEKMPYTSKHN